jgi:hypothetical protein
MSIAVSYLDHYVIILFWNREFDLTYAGSGLAICHVDSVCGKETLSGASVFPSTDSN